MGGDRPLPVANVMAGRGAAGWPLLVLVCLLVAVSLSGCSSGRERAVAMAGPRHLFPSEVDGGSFTLFTLAPLRWEAGAPLSVYLEGDGHAWIDRNHLSDDPTPRNPVALELAVRDPAENVVYIARPCQYVVAAALRNCQPAYWSTARYADEVVSAVNAAIERYRVAAGANRVRLYGYSGGGTLALLVAARRSDVAGVGTVSAVLDTAAWTRLTDATPLFDSLNPADFAARLAAVPQYHLVGADDAVVPPAVAFSYLSRFPADRRPRLVVVPGQGHECCWAEGWPESLGQMNNGAR